LNELSHGRRDQADTILVDFRFARDEQAHRSV
jgi:hypothetical protein